LIADNNGVARVISTLVANDIIHLIAKEIGRLTFSFIAPLGANKY
jgi:hypothetical protein